jgi:hypothetical protein
MVEAPGMANVLRQRGQTIAETSSSNLILSVWHPVHARGVGFGTASVAA